MKKITILFLSVFTLGLSVSSCSSDDDGDSSNSLEGKWELSEVGAILMGEEFLQEIENEGGCPNQTYEFLKENKFTETYSQFTEGKCEADSDNGTWAKNGNTLTFTYEGDSEGESYEVEIKGNKLKLKETYSEGGITVTELKVYTKK